MSRSSLNWQVEIRDSVEPFAAEWNALANPGNATPFQAYDLMRLFYATLAENRMAEPVVALARYRDGRPAALLPMMRSRKHGLNWLHTDARPIDYCAPIFDAALTPTEVKSIIDAVLAATPRADVFYCNKMPVDFQGVPNPIAALPNAGKLRFSAWMLRLGGRSEKELVAVRQARFRSNIRSRTQKLSAAYQRRFEIVVGEEITEADFAEFRELRSQSFEEKERDDILNDPRWLPFYSSLARGEGGSSRPWLSKLKADGELIAVLFGFIEGDRPVAIMPASKLGPWKTYAPGLQLFEETIGYFYARKAQCFDFSIGDMVYKRRFGCDETTLCDALFPSTIIGRIYYCLWKLKVKIRAKLKPISEET